MEKKMERELDREVKLIQIEEDIRADNRKEAEKVRTRLRETGTFMLNIMSSPGAGKTSVIIQTLKAINDRLSSAVIEADMDSKVDAESIVAAGGYAVQLRTGGFCHVDSYMVSKTISQLDLDSIDLLVLENVGNLICPAQSDTGAECNVMILSVPEGDDKPLKYPLMFRECEALIVNKTDYMQMGDFDMDSLYRRVKKLNANMPIFEVSCKTGAGIKAWSDWLITRMSR